MNYQITNKGFLETPSTLCTSVVNYTDILKRESVYSLQGITYATDFEVLLGILLRIWGVFFRKKSSLLLCMYYSCLWVIIISVLFSVTMHICLLLPVLIKWLLGATRYA